MIKMKLEETLSEDLAEVKEESCHSYNKIMKSMVQEIKAALGRNAYSGEAYATEWE